MVNHHVNKTPVAKSLYISQSAKNCGKFDKNFAEENGAGVLFTSDCGPRPLFRVAIMKYVLTQRSLYLC